MKDVLAIEIKDNDVCQEECSAILTLAQELEVKSKNVISEEIQHEIGKIVNILPSLAQQNDPVLDAQARISVASLSSDPANIELAKMVTKRLEERLKARNSPFFSAIRYGSPAIKVVLGLAFLLYIVIPLTLFSSTFLSKYEFIFGIKIEILGLVIFFGALGSIVSILVRLHQFSGLPIQDSSILFLTGLFKPIIGASFALFVYAIFNSGLLPIAVNPEKIKFFFVTLSFVAGFSERFAQDVVSKAEAAISGKN